MTNPMSREILTIAGDAAKALLSTMLGDPAPLRFSNLQPTEPDVIQDDVLSQLGIYPADGSYAVLLEPTWLPLIAGLKLGVETQVGDEDYAEIVKELAALFESAVTLSLHDRGTKTADADLQIKAPGDPLPDGVYGAITGRLPFFMEWDETIFHGFVLVGPVDTQDLQDSAETTSEDTIPKESMTNPQDESETEEIPIRVQAAAFPDLGTESMGGVDAMELGLLADVELEVTVELGRRHMSLSEVLRLTHGSVLELEKLVGEPLQVYANNRFIAEGEAVVIDEQFGVRITALASSGTNKVAH